MFQLMDENGSKARIKVIGVGGGGGNAVEQMLSRSLEGVEFICTNTDSQALKRLSGAEIVHLGTQLTRGLGAGADPEVGREAALENRDKLRQHLQDTDMVFITAGMGGGTGTGAAPVIAQIARELGVLSVAVVTRPFKFEGKKRARVAQEGIAALREAVDSLIILPNDKLVPVLGRKTSLLDAFAEANRVLHGAVQGIADLITRPGIINVDFADVRTVMSEMGVAMMGTGIAQGEGRASLAAEQAISSPLLEDIDLKGASGVLVNIAAGEDLSLGEFSEVGEIVSQYASEEATVVIGTVIDPALGDEIKVTLVATGLNRSFSLEKGPTETPVQIAAVNTESSTLAKATQPPNEIELPEILKRDRHEALLDRPQVRKAEFDLENLDIPAYVRR